MDEQVIQQITASTERLVAAAEALQQTLTVISVQQQEINAKIDRIVAAIEEKETVSPHPYAKERLEGGAPNTSIHASRKTLSPMVTMILAKSGVEEVSDSGVLDKALCTLTPEQRIAVKTEMARAGIIQ